MRSSLLGVLLFCTLLPVYGQQSQDISSLRTQLDNASTDSARVALMGELAIQLKDQGEIAEARQLLGKARKKARSLSSVHLIERLALDFADFYLSTDRPDSAIHVLERHLEQYPQGERTVNVLNLLATAYQFMANYDKSISLYQQAKTLVDSTDEPRTYNTININMAGIFKNQGNFGSALKYYQRGLEFAEADQDSITLATMLNNLGDTYNAQSNYEQGKYYLQKSVDVCKAVGYKIGLLRSYNNLANAEKGLGNLDKAQQIYNDALDLHQQLKPDSPPFRLTYNLGDLQLKNGQLAAAERSFQQSLEYSRQMSIPQGLYYNNTGLGLVAEQRNNLESSIAYFEEAAAIAQKLNMATSRRDATEKLYQLYKKKGDFKAAMEKLETNKTISDSLQEVATEKKLAETESQLKLRREQEVNQLLRERQQQQEARITAQYWLIVSGITVIIIILGSMYLLYRSSKQRKKMNRELEERRQELEELNDVKDKILAIISHDLRSPLASMKGLLYLLREDELSKNELNEMTAELEVSLNQNLSMMDNMLAWARQQMSGMAIDIGVVNAHEVSAEVVENFELQADHKNLSLINKVPKDLRVKADYNLLKLILRNLISNAIKFSEEGDRIIISTSRQDDEIVFEVADEGIGIPPATKQELFSFNQGSRLGTKNERGSGLGLQLCKEFVEKQHGEISMQSTVGEGSSFFFTLPQVN